MTKLEKRMSDLFPEDPLLARFSHRYTSNGFDPTAVRPIISPATQARPKAIPTIERPPQSDQNSPRPMPVMPHVSNSPKRPLMVDESDNEGRQPRKVARGESPLRGAAGRRLVNAQRHQQRGDNMGNSMQGRHQAPPPPDLPREVLFLLSIIPPASTYKATIFNPQKMVELLGRIDLSRANAGQAQGPAKPNPMGYMQQQNCESLSFPSL